MSININKKITRKEFLLSALSITALFFVSKVPNEIKKTAFKKENNSYGNCTYGGGQKNA